MKKLVCALAVLLAGCSFPQVALEDKACDDTHPCPESLVCALAVCKDPESVADRQFAAGAAWNTPVDDTPQLSAQSATFVAAIAGVRAASDGLQTNFDAYTTIVAFADAETPRGSVTDGIAGGWRMDDVPIPADAETAGDPQGRLVIVDRERDLVWNIRSATRSGLTITGNAFAVFRGDGPGFWDPSSSLESGLESNASYLGGLVFPEELTAGFIGHALAVQIDGSIVGPTPVPPALTSAALGDAGGVPVGTLLQLDPDYDISGLGREARVVAQAWKTYGAYLVERGSGFAIFFRSLHNLPDNPYAAMSFQGLRGELLRHLRVIAPSASYAYDSAAIITPVTPHRP